MKIDGSSTVTINYEYLIKYTDYSADMKRTCPIFGCKVTLSNGSATTSHGISITQDGNLTVNPNCGTSFCSLNYYSIDVDIFCSINRYINKTKKLNIIKDDCLDSRKY